MARPPAIRLISLAVLALIGARAWAAERGDGTAGAPSPFDDYEQLLPRGAIASVDDPRFVAAAEAEIPDAAWVLGITVDGQARAYSLNVLNHHEVVNGRSSCSAPRAPTCSNRR